MQPKFKLVDRFIGFADFILVFFSLFPSATDYYRLVITLTVDELGRFSDMDYRDSSSSVSYDGFNTPRDVTPLGKSKF